MGEGEGGKGRRRKGDASETRLTLEVADWCTA